MCMRSTSKKAEKIRFYYITLEKLVKNYTTDMLHQQAQLIEQLELDLKKPNILFRVLFMFLLLMMVNKIGVTENLNGTI